MRAAAEVVRAAVAAASAVQQARSTGLRSAAAVAAVADAALPAAAQASAATRSVVAAALRPFSTGGRSYGSDSSVSTSCLSRAAFSTSSSTGSGGNGGSSSDIRSSGDSRSSSSGGGNGNSGRPAVGAAYTMQRTFDAASVDTFTALTGDSNPIHSSGRGNGDVGSSGASHDGGSGSSGGGGGERGGSAACSASRGGAPQAIVPGMLLASLFPAIIGSTFPGALYATQTLAFRAQCTVGEPVTATVTVTRSSGRRVVFDTVVRAASDGRTLVDGVALAMIGEPASRRDGAAGYPAT